MAPRAVAAVDATASADASCADASFTAPASAAIASTAAASTAAASEEMALLESLFARHMRARAMLRSVVRAEQEAIAEIIWTLKAVPASRRQQMVALCVERAAAGLIRDTD